MKYHLRNWKCHYYSYEGGGSKKTILSLIKHVTLSLRRVGVKGISDNVTKYDVFLFWSRPLLTICPSSSSPIKEL